MAELSQDQIAEVVRAARLISRNLNRGLRAEGEQNVDAAAGTNDLMFDRVEQGRQLTIEHLSGRDDTNAPTRIRVGYSDGVTNHWLHTVPAPLTTESVAFNGSVTIGEGLYPIVRIEGATANDDLYAILNGYWTNL